MYGQSDLDLFCSSVSCNQISNTVIHNIIEQAVAPWPETNKSYFRENTEHLLPPAKYDTINGHNLFSLRGVEDRCVPLSK